jgi:hypothetical protein
MIQCKRDEALGIKVFGSAVRTPHFNRHVVANEFVFNPVVSPKSVSGQPLIRHVQGDATDRRTNIAQRLDAIRVQNSKQ